MMLLRIAGLVLIATLMACSNTSTAAVDKQAQACEEVLPPSEIRAALRQELGARLPNPGEVSATIEGGSVRVGIGEMKITLSRASTGEELKILLYEGNSSDGRALIILDENSWGWSSLMVELYKEGVTVLVVKVSERRRVEPTAGKLGWRVRDALTAIAYLRDRPDIQTIDLAGLGDAGPLALVVRAVCGNAVRRTYAENAAFSFSSVKNQESQMYLAAAHRYGDLGGIASAGAPRELFLARAKGFDASLLRKAYGDSATLRVEETSVPHSVLLDWLRKP